jgi:hypothetical protein
VSIRYDRHPRRVVCPFAANYVAIFATNEDCLTHVVLSGPVLPTVNLLSHSATVDWHESALAGTRIEDRVTRAVRDELNAARLA